MDLCNENHSESSETSSESKILNIFDEVAGDDSVQGQMYEFDDKEIDCAVWNDLANNRKIYENIVNVEEEKDNLNDIIPILDEDETKEQSGPCEITPTNFVEMPPNEMIEFNSQNAVDSIMSELQNIVQNSPKTNETDSIKFKPKPERIECSDSDIHIKRRLIIEEISAKKDNEYLPEAVGTNESFCKKDFVPAFESVVSKESKMLEISPIDVETSPEIQSNLKFIPKTVFLHECTHTETTVDEISSNELATELEEIPLIQHVPVEFNRTDAVRLIADDNERELISNDTSAVRHQSVSQSRGNEAMTEDYPYSQISIPVATKYQELKTRDHNIEEHFNTTLSGSAINEFYTSEESESDESGPQMAVETPNTMQKFLSKYNVFLETMGNRLNNLRVMTDQLRDSRAQIDEEYVQLDRPTTTESTAVKEENSDGKLYSDSETVECIDLTNRSEIIDRLLVTKSPLFDLSAEDVNRQVDVLRENNFNSTAEMIERVYSQRDRYALEGEHDEDNSTKDYYETFGDFIDDDKAEALVDENFNMEMVDVDRPEALHYLLDFEETVMKERENGGRLTIYCENVDKLVVEDSRFTPDLVGGNIRGVITEEDVPEELLESSEGSVETSIDR